MQRIPETYDGGLGIELKLNLEPKLRMALKRSGEDRKSTRLNSSHVRISYAVFCLKKKTSFLTVTAEFTSVCNKPVSVFELAATLGTTSSINTSMRGDVLIIPRATLSGDSVRQTRA